MNQNERDLICEIATMIYTSPGSTRSIEECVREALVIIRAADDRLRQADDAEG